MTLENKDNSIMYNVVKHKNVWHRVVKTVLKHSKCIYTLLRYFPINIYFFNAAYLPPI